MDFTLDTVGFEDVNIKFFFDHEKKVATIMSMEWTHHEIDTTHYLSLTDLDDFFLKERFVDAIKHVICMYVGFKWKIRFYTNELPGEIITKITDQINSNNCVFNEDICFTIASFVFEDFLHSGNHTNST